MSAKLSNNQKRYLSVLARRAFNRQAALARGRGEVMATDEADYRHAVVAEACGKLGLRCCSQDDYKAVEARLLDLLGEPGKALAAHMHAEGNARRIAEYKVIEACKDFGLSLNYAEAICRSQNRGKGLQDVTDKALWRVVFTVRNRGLKKRKEATI